MELTEGALSPAIFRQWSAIALVAGCLERRVWLKMGPRQTFANLYTLLVAPPGVGKYTIEEVKELWREAQLPGQSTGAFKVAPDSMSKASLVDALGRAKGMYIPKVGHAVTYHSLLVAAEEFAVLLPGYDLEFIGTLNAIYNNKTFHEETRRTGSVKELRIDFPQLNILGGAQPGWLASVFPEEAWSTGLASRLIMIYAPDVPIKDLFDDPGTPAATRKRILQSMTHLSKLYGQMLWQPAAAKRVGDWHLAGGPPQPTHSKLAHYNRRRTSLHMPKLAMVAAIARSGEMIIELEDVDRAIGWLLEAERLMPDIFRAMVGKSDSQIMEELHFFATSTWAKDKKPLHERLLVSFLSQRVPSDKVDKILQVCERSNMLVRQGGTETYTPRPRHEWGVE